MSPTMLSLTAGTVHSYWMNNELFTKELGAWKNKSCIANLLNLLTIKETFTSSNGERVVSEWADLCTKRPRLCKLSFQAIEMPNDIGQKNGLVSGTTAGSSARVETTLCDNPQSDFVLRSSSSSSVWALHHRGPCVDTWWVFSFLETSAALVMKSKC